MRRCLTQLDDSLPGLRGRALLLLGFAGAFQRSELAALLEEQTNAAKKLRDEENAKRGVGRE